jgi:hypothetical protein
MEGLVSNLIDACARESGKRIRASFEALAKITEQHEPMLSRLFDDDEREHEFKCFNTEVDVFCRRFNMREDHAYFIKLAYGTTRDWRPLIGRVADVAGLHKYYITTIFCGAQNMQNARDAQKRVRREMDGLNDCERVAVAVLESWRDEEATIPSKRLRFGRE